MNMTREEAALALAQSYVKEFKKYSFRVFNPNNVQSTKWWIHFLRAADLRYLEDWSPEIWVKCQFEKQGKIYPFRLYGKIATETFEEYKHRYIEKDNKDIQIIKGMLSTYKKIKDWAERNEKDISDFFDDRNNLKQVERNFYSKFFLAIFKPFVTINKEKEIINIEQLSIKRAYLYSKPRIIGKMKEVLGNNLF